MRFEPASALPRGDAKFLERPLLADGSEEYGRHDRDMTKNPDFGRPFRKDFKRGSAD
jgi:hypothetical protein